MVDPHIQRAVGLEAESAIRVIQLDRRNAQVQQDRVDRREFETLEDIRQMNEIIADQAGITLVILEFLGAVFDVIRVPINTDQLTGICDEG